MLKFFKLWVLLLLLVAGTAVAATSIIANYTPLTYYNNANIGTPSSVPSNDPEYFAQSFNNTISK